jgi:hypothetical protein
MTRAELLAELERRERMREFALVIARYRAWNDAVTRKHEAEWSGAPVDATAGQVSR